MAIGFLCGVQNAAGDVLLGSERKFLDPVRLIQWIAVQSAIAGPGDVIFARTFDPSVAIPDDWPSVLAGGGGGGPVDPPLEAAPIGSFQINDTRGGGLLFAGAFVIFGFGVSGQNKFIGLQTNGSAFFIPPGTGVAGSVDTGGAALVRLRVTYSDDSFADSDDLPYTPGDFITGIYTADDAGWAYTDGLSGNGVF